VDDIRREIDQVAAEADFHGTVRIDRDGEVVLARAYGLAHRGYAIANTVDTRFGIASGGKTFTALAVVHLVERGLLELTTTARSILGEDLPLIDDGVTIEHLLAHRSGIGDYLDEDLYDDFDQYIMPVPVQELATTEQFLAILDGYPRRFPPGERFSYCNGGYVVLALIAERVSGEPYHDLVVRTVCEPAGMTDTGFPRSDEPDGRTALGYLQMGGAWRTNVFHLPVRATGDGGIHSTVGDISALWTSLLDGRIVSPASVAEMFRPRSDLPESSASYGLGFWSGGTSDRVGMVGDDAGTSFWSTHVPSSATTITVMSNVTNGTEQLGTWLRQQLLPSG
jgi:CubicO group peptidase (beta-lactamase class C family)